MITVPGSNTLRRLGKPLLQFLEGDGVTEVCVNKPGEVWVEAYGEWTRFEEPELDFDTLAAIAVLAAAMSGQDISETRPICSTVMPGGERTQVLVPPAVAPGTVAFAIRKPSSFRPDLRRLGDNGLFQATERATRGLTELDHRLVELRDARRWMDFLELAVTGRKNIGITGPVGSGKTTLMKALVAMIPAHERLVSIEDTAELFLRTPNSVSLFYSKGRQGAAADVTSTALLEASLRMYPSRVLMGELRDEAAFTYIRGGAAGHPGSIATWHAQRATEARSALALMIKQHEAGRQLTDETIDGLLHQFVDVIVFCEREGDRFAVREVLFEPERAEAAA